MRYPLSGSYIEIYSSGLDYVLQELSKMLQDNIRTNDTIARWGGEEFLVLCLNTNDEQAEEFSQRLRKNTEELDLDKGIIITLSFGVTAYKKGDTVNSFIYRADKALYQAKQRGRNQLVIG